jgi:IS5 family transposase
MPQMEFLQQWFGLSDDGLEGIVDDSRAMLGCLGIVLGHEGIPDAAFLRAFRHLPEQHDLTAKRLETVNRPVTDPGRLLANGTPHLHATRQPASGGYA